MKALTKADHIVITAVHRIDGDLILETNCGNFDDYKALPSVVIYEGTICGLSGWSSDRN